MSEVTLYLYLTESVYKVFLTSATLSFIITDIQNELTDLCWNCLLQNTIINTFCEINLSGFREGLREEACARLLISKRFLTWL